MLSDQIGIGFAERWINIFLFTPKLKNIFDEVYNTGHKLDIKFKLSKSGSMNDCGVCTKKKDDNNIPYIEIKIREDRLTEDVISHELLHALFIKKGFPSTRFNTIGNLPFERITGLLHSILEHKKIYEMQKCKEIDIVQAQMHKANTIFRGTEKEQTDITYYNIVNSLLLLDCIIGANEYKYLYIERIKTCFNHTYELANKLAQELFSKDIDDAVIFREHFIKGLRIFDDYLSKHMSKSIPYFKLTENISISYIPYECELLLKAEQIFHFKESMENKNNLIILSKQENQACYIINKMNNTGALKIMSVEELIGSIDGLITIRPKRDTCN